MLTYLKLHSIGDNEYALTNHLMRYIDKYMVVYMFRKPQVKMVFCLILNNISPLFMKTCDFLFANYDM